MTNTSILGTNFIKLNNRIGSIKKKNRFIYLLK